VGRADGLRDEEIAGLADYTGRDNFDRRDKAALAYAEAIATSNTVPDSVFRCVRDNFTDDEIVELTAIITWEICAAKFNRALEIEAQGVCLLPARAESEFR
jgi:alkylhydroperoxidase family enzyme